MVGGNFYFVVIAGDVNSDGDVTATDYLLLKRHFVVPGSKALSEVALRASSLERTSVPTPSDYLKIKRYILTGLYDLVKNEPIQCTHEKWIDADCEQAKRCALCGKTEGKPLGHNWPGLQPAPNPSAANAAARPKASHSAIHISRLR